MISNLLNSLSSDRSQTDNRPRKNNNEALTDLDGADPAVLDFGDTSVPTAPAHVHGQAPINAGAVATSNNAGADAALSTNVAALPAAGSPSPTTLTVGSGGGIIFNNTFDSTCSQAYINCVVAAENAIRGQWTNSITLNLDFTAKTQGTSTFLATNSASSGVNVTYDQLKKALQTADWGSPDTYAQTAAWFLPASSPSGTKDFSLPEAYARMLGLSSATPSVDDTVTLNTSFNWSFGQDVTNTIEHELTEGGMGRVGGLGDNNNGWSTIDLFRYNASGALDVTDGRDGKTTFFSFNGGSTLSSLAWNNEFNAMGTRANSEDTSDFVEQDIFGTGSPGETNTISATDLNVMDVLGWIPSSPHGTPSVGASNLTIWENTSINGLGLQETTNVSSDSITEYAFRDQGGNGHLTLDGKAEPNGQWVYVSAGDLANLTYVAGANPGTDTVQVTAFDATLSKWLGIASFPATTTVEPVANLKNFAVAEGQSLSVGPITSVSNPSGDSITDYAFMDAGTNGHFAAGGTAEPNSKWVVVPWFGLEDIQYVAGSTTGTDPIEVRVFDASTERWTAVSDATATTRQPILPPPGGGGPTPSPVNALSVMAPTSGATGAAAVTNKAADTLVGFADATLVGSAASDTFVIGAGAGHETIQNFDPAHDILQFSASLFANYAAAMTDARQVGADTVFAIDARDSVTLQNVNVSSLAASNVHVG
jgi:hypothetical protein